MSVSLLSGNLLGLVVGYAVGCCTPGVIRVIRAKIFGAARKVETIAQSNIKKL